MKTNTLPPFHLAFPVDDLAQARAFYRDLLGCTEGRSADTWVDFNFFGHQIVAHLASAAPGRHASGDVDAEKVPVPHFGVILAMPDWQRLADRLRAAGVAFLLEPQVRFVGRPGEQVTLFVLDPSGNALEFKAFADPRAVFATD